MSETTGTATEFFMFDDEAFLDNMEGHHHLLATISDALSNEGIPDEGQIWENTDQSLPFWSNLQIIMRDAPNNLTAPITITKHSGYLVNADTLSPSIEFDSPFRVVEYVGHGQTLIESPLAGHHAPSVMLYVDRDGQGVGDEEIDGSNWTPVTGFSGQQGYSGPTMHASEFLGGDMAESVLDDYDEIYVITSVECLPMWDATEDETDEVRDGEPAGWMLLKYTKD